VRSGGASFHENDKCADALANISCMFDGNIVFYENCTQECSHIVLADVLGIATSFGSF
jgi:hypothetical protein